MLLQYSKLCCPILNYNCATNMSPLPHNGRPDFEYGVADKLSENIRRVICNNPGPFTFTGTGTYLVGNGQVAVIDPGPADELHINALLEATQGERITHILVTHTHLDHSPGCALLQRHCDALTYAYGPHGASGFGADMEFKPDVILAHGDTLEFGDMMLEAVYTPGHASNHLSFNLSPDNVLFCGDVVMGWSSTIVMPPDGNMKSYMSSLELLMQRDDRLYYPTHGSPLANPRNYVLALYKHRQERMREVLRYLEPGEAELGDLVLRIYRDLDPAMLPAAEKSLLATLEYLIDERSIIQSSNGHRETYQLAH